MNEHIKVNDKLDLEIKRMGINGEGIAYYQKLAIFIDQAIPGELIEASIDEVYDNRALAHIESIKQPSVDRKTPFCPVYETCGGCQTQHINYEALLHHKRDILLKSFDRYAGLKITEKKVKPTIGAKNPEHYRNKASLPIQYIKGKNRFGMYAKNSNQFIPIEGCPVQHDVINKVLRKITSLMDTFGIQAYDSKTKQGYVRHLVVRIAEHTGEVQVSFIMLKKSNRLDDLTKKLIELEPEIVSVYEVMNEDMRKMGFFTEQKRLVYGKETITETLNGHAYILKPEAFFQLNTTQADLFYHEMKRLAQLKPHEVAIDAYAGIAPVSHYIHDQAKKVFAIEMDASACESARLSLEKNGIKNVTVLQSDFKRALSGLKEKKIDVMFFDPPRVGLGDDTIELILQFKPKRLIYGSCNPSTLAKDLNALLTHYDLVETVPIDMFPYTSLVESVSLLTLK
ncbi:MAG TPA: 23S rRNA (uracil(1939)-C(5))-methyltransferase RlmD [Acholeplasmataceae bacterium]|nr:23S rRNA (uracil(1939)-C(5))-methyltransferase RlmD [Acholeplasmataceae bacterium]